MDIPPPNPEGYGTALLVKIERGAGSYSGDLGVWFADAHIQKDRLGSFNEYDDQP